MGFCYNILARSVSRSSSFDVDSYFEVFGISEYTSTSSRHLNLDPFLFSTLFICKLQVR